MIWWWQVLSATPPSGLTHCLSEATDTLSAPHPHGLSNTATTCGDGDEESRLLSIALEPPGHDDFNVTTPYTEVDLADEAAGVAADGCTAGMGSSADSPRSTNTNGGTATWEEAED